MEPKETPWTSRVSFHPIVLQFSKDVKSVFNLLHSNASNPEPIPLKHGLSKALESRLFKALVLASLPYKFDTLQVGTHGISKCSHPLPNPLSDLVSIAFHKSVEPYTYLVASNAIRDCVLTWGISTCVEAALNIFSFEFQSYNLVDSMIISLDNIIDVVAYLWKSHVDTSHKINQNRMSSSSLKHASCKMIEKYFSNEHYVNQLQLFENVLGSIQKEPKPWTQLLIHFKSDPVFEISLFRATLMLLARLYALKPHDLLNSKNTLIYLINNPLCSVQRLEVLSSFLFLLERLPEEPLHETLKYLQHHQLLLPLVSMIVQYVSQCVIQEVEPTFQLLRICEFALKLYRFNEEHKAVDFTVFYCHDLMIKEWPLKTRFLRWKAHRMKNIVKKDIFDYPYLLNPLMKQCLLRIESFVTMLWNVEKTCSIMLLDELFVKWHKLQFPTSIHLKLNIRRDMIVQDTIVELAKYLNDLNRPLLVAFQGEIGLDAGGVQKEFFYILINELFKLNYGLWEATESKQYYWFPFNPQLIKPPIKSGDYQPLKSSTEQRITSWIDLFDVNLPKKPVEKKYVLYKLCGILCFLAIYNGVTLDVQWPPHLFKYLLNEPIEWKDIRHIDPSLYQGFEALLNYHDEDFESTFDLTFEIFDNGKVIPLKPLGEEIRVTQENKLEFVELYSRYILVEKHKKYMEALKIGFQITHNQSSYLHENLRWEEFKVILSGVEDEINFNVLRKSCEYIQYSENDPVIEWFWEIVHGMNQEEKKNLLSFTTGSSRIPLGGLETIPFKISRSGDSQTRLPSAHTCFSILALPEYASKEILRERLLKSIEHHIGFDLV